MAGEHARVLVVDDNRLNRLKLCKTLEKQGYVVALAEGGEEALLNLRTGVFDLVLLDVLMPGIDGLQVLEAMQNDAALRDIPVIMISAENDDESVGKCLQLGAEDYLSKEVEPSTLHARVAATLERRKVVI